MYLSCSLYKCPGSKTATPCARFGRRGLFGHRACQIAFAQGAHCRAFAYAVRTWNGLLVQPMKRERGANKGGPLLFCRAARDLDAILAGKVSGLWSFLVVCAYPEIGHDRQL